MPRLPDLLDTDRVPPFTPAQGELCVLLSPRLGFLAADVWELGRKSPAVPADPALVALAARRLGELRRLLRDEPGVHLLPGPLTEGIRLHALGVVLRDMERALKLFISRRRPFATLPERPPALSDRLETINAIAAELTRGALLRIADGTRTELPPELRPPEPEAPPAPPAPPRGGLQKPMPHIRRARLRRIDERRRRRRSRA